MHEIRVQTSRTEELLDITDAIRDALREADAAGASSLLVFCPHTTAGLLINEGCDPSVADDLGRFLAQCVPEGVSWKHAEGNTPAHIKATIVGASVWVPIVDGRLLLGRWQAVFLAEFDGPRERRILLQLGA